MKIIDQGYEIISLPDSLLQAIEAAGRTCYKSENKIGCSIPEDKWKIKDCPENLATFDAVNLQYHHDCLKCSKHSSHKFTKMLLDRGHHAMLEFGDIIVRFVTNRGVTHELVRHRLCSFAQESTRYVRYDGKMEFIRPVWCSEAVIGIFECPQIAWHKATKQECLEMAWVNDMVYLEQRYQKYLQDGWRPEQAREVLPNSLKTEIVVKGNIREWRHCLTLRTSKKAHPQIRSLLTPLLKELQQKIPILFDDIKET
jgi:thymidylate synthase (FAD)